MLIQSYVCVSCSVKILKMMTTDMFVYVWCGTQELDQRYNALLQMYGEKVEEAEELRLDLQDVKEMYKSQVSTDHRGGKGGGFDNDGHSNGPQTVTASNHDSDGHNNDGHKQ